jgi:hypothetical protein
MLVSSLVGVILGAIVAYVGATYVFVCRPVSFTTSDAASTSPAARAQTARSRSRGECHLVWQSGS